MKFRLLLAAMAGICCVPLLAADNNDVQRAAPPEVKPDSTPQDRAKTIAIEAPVKFLLVDAPPAPAESSEPNLDVRKYDAEIPSKLILAEKFAPAVSPEPPVGEKLAPAAEHTTVRDNPQVAPGKVTWHKDFAAARAASKKSGKPVLLFQMMGNLDDRFC